MKVLNKELFPLKNGNLFAMLQVEGKQGDIIRLAEEGISGQAIFYSEAPKSKFNCVNPPELKELELGGSEEVSERTVYLAGRKNGKENDEDGNGFLFNSFFINSMLRDLY